MSVKLLDNDAFYGYRVRRTVDAKLYQEYFSLKKNGKRGHIGEIGVPPHDARYLKAMDRTLAHLQKLPIAALKVDQSFIAGIGRDDDDETVVNATLALATPCAANSLFGRVAALI